MFTTNVTSVPKPQITTDQPHTNHYGDDVFWLVMAAFEGYSQLYKDQMGALYDDMKTNSTEAENAQKESTVVSSAMTALKDPTSTGELDPGVIRYMRDNGITIAKSAAGTTSPQTIDQFIVGDKPKDYVANAKIEDFLGPATDYPPSAPYSDTINQIKNAATPTDAEKIYNDFQDKWGSLHFETPAQAKARASYFYDRKIAYQPNSTDPVRLNKADFELIKGALDTEASKKSDFGQTAQLKLTRLTQSTNLCYNTMSSALSALFEVLNRIAQKMG